MSNLIFYRFLDSVNRFFISFQHVRISTGSLTMSNVYESPPFEDPACEAALPVEDPAMRGSVVDAKGGH